MLNIAGSFATGQLRKIFNLAGGAQPSASEDIQLIQALDPERLQPYGQWRRAAVGFTEDTTLAQPYSFGIINPSTSNSICVIDSVRVQILAAWALTGAVTATLDVATAAFAPVDDTDPSIPSCPIKWFRNTIRGASGTQIGNAIGGPNVILHVIDVPYPLYPGHEINWGLAPSGPVTVAYRFSIRWLSPTP